MVLAAGVSVALAGLAAATGSVQYTRGAVGIPGPGPPSPALTDGWFANCGPQLWRCGWRASGRPGDAGVITRTKGTDTMASKPLLLFIGTYPSEADARADEDTVKQVYRDELIGSYDAAVVVRDAG